MGFDTTFDRTTGIGASEVAAIVGCDPFRTSLDVWLRKTKRIAEQETSAAMRWGQIVEASLLDSYRERFPDLIVEGVSSPIVFAPHCFSTPDAVARRRGRQEIERAVEGKNTGSAMIAALYGEEGTSEVPEHVYVQTQWQLAALDGVKRNDVIACLLGQPPAVFTIERDDNLIAGLRDAVDRFWHDHVEADVPPALDLERVEKSAIQALFPKPTRGMLELASASRDTRSLFDAFANLYLEEKAIATALEMRDKEIRLALAEHEGALYADGRKIYFRKNKDGSKTDWQAIVAALREQAVAQGGESADAFLALLDDAIAKHTKTVPGARVLRPYLDAK